MNEDMGDFEFPIVGVPYYVAYDNCTDIEPKSGWYFSVEHEDNEDFFGPYETETKANHARMKAQTEETE